MAYELHIERGAPITLDDWLAVVLRRPDLRLVASEDIASNPKTGEHIAVPSQAGEASMQIDGCWVRGFRWTESGIHLKAPADTSTGNAVMALALDVAFELSALVRGDEGETYNAS